MRPPSPVAATLLGLQRAGAFDALIVEPEGRRARVGVIFLHGYAGSFTVECWHFVRAARAIGALKVCPSMDASGEWWRPDGVAIVDATLRYMASRGVSRVVLAGLSNGAVGAHRIARRFAPRLAGLVLISGASAFGSSAGVPTLVVRGTDDALGRSAIREPEWSEFTIAGGHFVFLSRADAVRDAIARWLVTHVGAS